MDLEGPCACPPPSEVFLNVMRYINPRFTYLFTLEVKKINTRSECEQKLWQ